MYVYVCVYMYIQANNPSCKPLMEMDEQWLQLWFVIFFVLVLSVKVKALILSYIYIFMTNYMSCLSYYWYNQYCEYTKIHAQLHTKLAPCSVTLINVHLQHVFYYTQTSEICNLIKDAVCNSNSNIV